jgi:RimJ/RimL family protein N-acetyltransferase
MNFSFSGRTIGIFNAIKAGSYRGPGFTIPVTDGTNRIATLRPVTRCHLRDTPENNHLVSLLSEWRASNQEWYPSVFRVTEEGTKKWLKNQVIETDDRILFLIESVDRELFGHMGLFRGEIDNVLRGRTGHVNAGMTHGMVSLMKWSASELSLKQLHLRVFWDNTRAIEFYEKCGFCRIGRIPLRKMGENGMLRWVPNPDLDVYLAERTFCVMHCDLEKYTKGK